MKTVNSISGGKTSSYMALNYPADYNIFALVRIEAEYCKPKDESIVKYVSDKIGMDFIATAESDLTLYAVRDLEQKIGKEIVWVTGETFEQVIINKKALPNLMQRFCTTEMKIRPIAEYCLYQIGEIVEMRLGIRYDEMERKNQHNTSFKIQTGCTIKNKRKKWQELEYRALKYPLLQDRINTFHIWKWHLSQNINFPPDSNCVGCFWKHVQQLRKNFDDEPLKMQWFAEQEIIIKRKFKKEMTYNQIKGINLQPEFSFGTGSGCNAGACMD
jgi:hypothetical protein